jgi:hypothetical protein
LEDNMRLIRMRKLKGESLKRLNKYINAWHTLSLPSRS